LSRSKVIVAILIYGPLLFLDYQRSELLFYLIKNGHGKITQLCHILLLQAAVGSEDEIGQWN
jgi:hypothetical protein